MELQKPDETPELEDIVYLIEAGKLPAGIIFVVREYDESAYIWIAPRLEYYVDLLLQKYPELSIAVVSHGDEILALTSTNEIEYAGVHDTVRRITEKYGVDFQVCGAFAAFNGLSESDFPSFIDVVPYGPSSISDYRSLNFELIDLELTW